MREGTEAAIQGQRLTIGPLVGSKSWLWHAAVLLGHAPRLLLLLLRRRHALHWRAPSLGLGLGLSLGKIQGDPSRAERPGRWLCLLATQACGWY